MAKAGTVGGQDFIGLTGFSGWGSLQSGSVRREVQMQSGRVQGGRAWAQEPQAGGRDMSKTEHHCMPLQSPGLALSPWVACHTCTYR